ncbi:MAG: glycosyltransferase [Agathobaculum sp.]|uniref:glycosyltransferase n=1 Tax=Agathobaculum sp. TaxID=2048138 RepID=UPI0025C73A56|nr:glycosyltransferase [Agathobaculum sp.]MCI7126430.1 glycosyltransferase [Agathobaculum sp.]
MPLISVLIGTLYRQRDISFLKRSIRSILGQTMADMEVLVCDDGSTEDAKCWLDGLSAQDGRLVLVRQGDLLALPQKLNACIRQAKGQWLARMDDDDYAASDRFEKQIAFLDAHPEIAFVGSCAKACKSGAEAGVLVFPPLPEVKDFFFSQPFLHPSLMFRRQALLQVNGYSEDVHCILCEDYDLLLRLYAAGYRGANIQETLLTYTLPETAKGSRRMRHRWNEAVTRYRRFQELKVLPAALPYVVKPIAVGLLPGRLLHNLKELRQSRTGREN